MNKDYNTPIWQLTIGEFVELLSSQVNTIQEKSTIIEHEQKYVYGLKGLSNILGCSKNYAWKLKNSGMFDEAIIQNGRKIIIDSEKALKLFNNHKNI